MKSVPIVLLLIGLACSVPALAGTKVLMQTNLGDITLELEDEQAPNTVRNFLDYAESGIYDGTIFHRVIGDFMIQGGGFDAQYQRRATRPPVDNEADNGLSNTRGTISMARTTDPHSATSQFFINVEDNTPLDYRSSDPSGWGYCVFGNVVDGMDVVDKIRSVPTGPGGPFTQDAPQTPVIIEKVSVQQ